MDKILKFILIPHYLLYPAVFILGLTIGIQFDVAGMAALPDGARNFLQPARYAGPAVGEKEARIEWAFRTSDGVSVLKEKLFSGAHERILIANCSLNAAQRLVLAKAVDRGVKVNLIVASPELIGRAWLEENRISAVAANAGAQGVIIVDKGTIAVGSCDPGAAELDSVLTVWNSPAMVNAYARKFEAAWSGGRPIYTRRQIH